MISIAIGLVLIFLILSLLATSLQEVIAGWMSLRGKMLERALEKLLTNETVEGKIEEGSKELFERFKKHNWYGNMKPDKRWYHFFGGIAPSYISGSSFVTIFLQTLDGSDISKVKQGICDLPDGKLKTFLLDTLNDVNEDIDKFKKRLEEWYDGTMDRATGWYKRKVHQILLMIGMGIAIVFNADTLSIYNKLSNDPAARAEAIAVAQEFVDQGLNQKTQNLNAVNVEQLNELQNQIHKLVSKDIASVRSPLGLGWSEVDKKQIWEEGFIWWLKKILGFIVTALAISLGAPFWFDLLKKVMNVRNSGK